MLLKEAETVEDGTSSCSDLILLDFSFSIQLSFDSLDWVNASIVADHPIWLPLTNGANGDYNALTCYYFTMVVSCVLGMIVPFFNYSS